MAVWSYVEEMTSGATVPYHTVVSDTEKRFANLTRNVDVGLETYADLFEQLEVLPFAVGFDLTAFGLDGLRWAASVFATAVMVVEGMLYQGT
ncbi:hypothetical protein [Pyxidicoccus caerfyrddinensis]|uniref:hypothetical protein n=1 Tax=Pyxidicoccus caerfyrddinensis TaxID=2709663 RepID=UPI0013DD5D46|nr:hypothetical protein [Pyxidicoccus caerfyrddinensis]